MQKKILILILFIILLVLSIYFLYLKNKATPSKMSGEPETYVLVHSSKYWEWYAFQSTWDRYFDYFQEQLSYPDQVYEELSSLLNIDLINNTPTRKLYLLVDEKTGGGFASHWISEIEKGPGIGVAFDAWFNPYVGDDYWSYELIAHETVNVFTGYIVSGWPVDWWANGRSPFPYALKILVEKNTGHYYSANKSLENADELSRLFLHLMDRFGDDIYMKMLQNISDDGWITWTTINTGNPSKLLSEYIAAYLSIAAGENLTDDINIVFSNFDISYRLDPDIVKHIIDIEKSLQNISREDASWITFREGKNIPNTDG